MDADMDHVELESPPSPHYIRKEVKKSTLLDWAQLLLQVLALGGVFAALCAIVALFAFFTDLERLHFGNGSNSLWSTDKTRSQFAELVNTESTLESCDKSLYKYTRKLHVSGTEEAKQMALEFEEHLKQLGLNDTYSRRYDVYLTHGTNQNRLSFFDESSMQHLYEFDLSETEIPEDPDTSGAESIPAYNAYSTSGEIITDIYYVNYGSLEDYKYLESINISVKGKIVLVRYGKIGRMVKSYLAERYGAKGMIIYSDPADDGNNGVDVYPNGPYRNGRSFQRGSCQFLSISPGDPLTPGFASVPELSQFSRKSLNESENIPKDLLIIPMGYNKAARILEKLEGDLAPSSWQGGITSVQYRIGGSLKDGIKMYMKVQMNPGIYPIYNVFAKIEGAEEPDRVVIMGAHRDAWVYGAVDPHTSTMSFLEVARALGQMLRQGWRPRRTILLASWDAEEWGLIGSTEWCEENQKILSQQAVAYLNCDTFTGDIFQASLSPSLAKVITDESKQVPYDQKQSLYDHWKQKKDGQFTYLGSGSDYTPFLQYLGIPSADMRFTAKFSSYGTYHSAYDTYHYVKTQIDPNMFTCRRLALIWGSVLLRLAQDPLIALDTNTYITTLSTEIEVLLQDNVLWQPVLKKFTPEMQNIFNHYKNLFDNTVKRLEETTIAIEAERKTLVSNGTPSKVDRDRIRRLNDKLLLFERSFINPDGLPGRSWYKHLIFAPGMYLGYGYEVFPGIREALRNQDPHKVFAELERVIVAIDRAQKTLEGNF